MSMNRDWDDHLPYLLFAYRVSIHEPTRESPFFLVYGRDARIPTDTVLTHQRSPYAVDIVDYREDILSSLSAAWKLASDNIGKAQDNQKKHQTVLANLHLFVLVTVSWFICHPRLKGRTGSCHAHFMALLCTYSDPNQC